jgi:hypothetical protein
MRSLKTGGRNEKIMGSAFSPRRWDFDDDRIC